MLVQNSNSYLLAILKGMRVKMIALTGPGGRFVKYPSTGI